MDQKAAIEKLFHNKQFRLIVLDACRADAFVEEINVPGEYQVVRSGGSCTRDWAKATFQSKYPDVLFISSVPYISGLSIGGWRATEHFGEVYPAWRHLWGDVDGIETVLPWLVVAEALKRNAPRMIVHLMQPHFPYIGDVRFDAPNPLATSRASAIAGGDGLVACDWQKVYPPDEKLRKAYMANLRLVLREIQPLLGPGVVITADHGELLGEGGQYSHPPGSNHPILRSVPWFIVK